MPFPGSHRAPSDDPLSVAGHFEGQFNGPDLLQQHDFSFSWEVYHRPDHGKVESSQADALWIIRVIGGGPARIVLGFMIAAAFLSMWISNTATAIMMLPIGMAIIYEMEAKFSPAQTHNFTVALMLGIAYACSVGGLATIVGTPPNLSFVRIFEITFPQAGSITLVSGSCWGCLWA